MKAMTFEEMQQVEGGDKLGCESFGVVSRAIVGATYGAIFGPYGMAAGLVAGAVGSIGWGLFYNMMADC